VFIRKLISILQVLSVCTVLLAMACSPLKLGSAFRVDPATQLKIGHDHKKDVLNKMGPPYRRVVDAKGREILTYLWANGEGKGRKCILAFNKNGVLSIVEVSP